MEHLDFILWMALFPISISICGYIDEKKYKVKGERKVFKESTEVKAAVFYALLWLGVGYLLF